MRKREEGTKEDEKDEIVARRKGERVRIDARSTKDEERGNVGGKTNGRSWGSQVGTFDTSGRVAGLPTEMSRIPERLDKGDRGDEGITKGKTRLTKDKGGDGRWRPKLSEDEGEVGTRVETGLSGTTRIRRDVTKGKNEEERGRGCRRTNGITRRRNVKGRKG